MKLAVGLVLVATALGCVRSTPDFPSNAASEAESFVRLTVVDRDYDSAYALLTPGFREVNTVANLRGLIAGLHSDGRPTQVSAIEYESLPGEESVNIYLLGNNGASSFYYQVVMLGLPGDDHVVGGLSRGSDPYPPSEWRLPLP